MLKGFSDLVDKARTDVEGQLEVARQQELLQQQQEIQKKRIQSKQMRALRNNFRPAGGFLQPGGRGMSLGESTGLPSKLGIG